MKLNPQIKAFTLVELLVVITIIATLAGIAFPVYNTVQERGKQTKALTHAKQLGLSCKVYSSDYDGAFPKYIDPTADEPELAEDNSNQALQSLIDGGYVPDEGLFPVQGSKWSNKAPDNDKLLEAGENHWAYYAGINDTDTPGWPLLVDGWAEGEVGVYTDNTTQPGGVWKGKKAIVIRVDMSGRIENLNKDFEVRGITTGTDKENVLAPTDEWMGSDVKALLPDKDASGDD